MDLLGPNPGGQLDPFDALVLSLFRPGWHNQETRDSFWAGLMISRMGTAMLPGVWPATLGAHHPFWAGMLTCR